MRHLTLSILVTLAVLLGSAGVSWSEEVRTDPEDLANEFIESRNWNGFNNKGKENE